MALRHRLASNTIEVRVRLERDRVLDPVADGDDPLAHVGADVDERAVAVSSLVIGPNSHSSCCPVRVRRRIRGRDGRAK